MKTIILVLVLIPSLCFAGNTVRVKATGEVVYQQVPDFPDGKGIYNALIDHPQYNPKDLEEVTLSKADFMQVVNDKIAVKKAEEKIIIDKVKLKFGWIDEDISNIKKILSY